MPGYAAGQVACCIGVTSAETHFHGAEAEIDQEARAEVQQEDLVATRQSCYQISSLYLSLCSLLCLSLCSLESVAADMADRVSSNQGMQLERIACIEVSHKQKNKIHVLSPVFLLPQGPHQL